MTIQEKQVEIKELLGKIDKIHKKKHMRSVIVTLVLIIVVICFFAKGISAFKAAKESNHVPVMSEDVSVSPSMKPLKRYEFNTNITGTEGNYYIVEIDGNKTKWNKEDVSKYLSGKTVDTEIYELTCVNNQKYPFKFITPKKIVFRRYSVRGEHNFTDEEINSYKQMAADYFTYKKYQRFGYDDTLEYENALVDDSNALKDEFFQV